MGDRLEREPRADGVCAEPEEGRNHMRVADLVALDDDSARHPQPLLHEPVVDGRDGQE